MASAGSDLVQEIKQRVDILEVVSEYVKLRPAGTNRHVGLCPFHSEKTPSFGVSSERQSWYCFGCSEGGDVLKFVEKIENLSFRETLERLAKRAGIVIPESGGSGPSASERDRLRSLQELACRFYERELARSTAARDYLAARGVSDETARAFRLGLAPDSWDSLRSVLRRERATDDDLERAGLYKKKSGESGGYDFFRNRLMFPICDLEGRVIAFGGRLMGEGQPKYLNSPDTPVFSKKRVLYGLQRALPAIKERREALVVEGYMDLLAAHEFGFTSAVAPLGTALTEEHLKLFKRWCDRVLLVFDADGAGMKAALRSLGLFEQSEIEARVVVLPPGEDPDSLLRKQGAAPFAQALEAARPILDYRMETVLRQHDVRSDEGFTKAMRSIAPLLAQVVSAETWIHRVAELRSEGAPERVAFHEEDVRRRIRQAPVGANPQEFEGKPEVGKPQDAPSVGSATRRLHKAEDEILRACLNDAEIAEQLMARLPPERFLRPETRDLAALIAARTSEKEWNPGAWVVDSDAVQTLLGRLAADPAPMHWLEKCVSLLTIHWDRAQLKALTEGRTPTVEELGRIKEFYQQKQQTGSG